MYISAFKIGKKPSLKYFLQGYNTCSQVSHFSSGYAATSAAGKRTEWWVWPKRTNRIVACTGRMKPETKHNKVVQVRKQVEKITEQAENANRHAFKVR